MKHPQAFSRRHPGVRSNIGDPVPHAASNRVGEVSEAARARSEEAAETFIRDSRTQGGR